MSDSLRVKVENAIALVEMRRPAQANAIDFAQFDALAEAGRALAADSSLRAVVLTGAGDNFCAGIDLHALTEGTFDSKDLLPGSDSAANRFQAATCVWRDLPVPVIAALQGVVYGAGLQLALACDLRIAAPDTRLSVMEVKWGLVPDMGLSLTLPPLLRYDRAAELLWTGQVISSDEARACGLVTVVADNPRERAFELATDLSRKSPDAIRAGKVLLRSAYADSEARLLGLEARLQGEILRGSNFREAVSANMEKRTPGFRDPGS